MEQKKQDICLIFTMPGRTQNKDKKSRTCPAKSGRLETLAITGHLRAGTTGTRPFRKSIFVYTLIRESVMVAPSVYLMYGQLLCAPVGWSLESL
jgi:hypothetical protein